jgi:hypothetical protein
VHPSDTTKATLIRLAPEYSAGSTYALGVFVSLASTGLFYECTSAIATPEAWTAGHWTARTVGYVLAALATSLAGKATSAQGIPTGGTAGQALVKSGMPDFVTEWAAVGRTNPNLLDNWDFANPVNTYGRLSGNAGVYTGNNVFPCWISWGSITWIEGTGVSLAANTTWQQRLEIPYTSLLGKTTTISVKLSNGTYALVTATFPSSVSGADAYNGGALSGVGSAGVGFEYRSGGVTIGGMTQYYVPFVQIATVSGTPTVREMYCELGSVSTHPTAKPMDYGIACCACKRYVYSTMQAMQGTIEADIAYVNIKFEHEMRIPPSLISYPSTAWLIAGGSSGTQSLPSSPLRTITKESAMVKINASGYPGFNVALASSAVAPFVFSAEL